MKKILFSLVFLISFAGYAFSAQKNPSIAPVELTSAAAANGQGNKPKGTYTDGAYTGSSVDAYYGNVQVQTVIKNGLISNVQILDNPKDRQTSVAINNRALPILKSEIIQAQSANVNMVSGATATSRAFLRSVSSALAQATK